MPKPPQAEEIFIDGPAGKLEGRLETPDRASPPGLAVVCHPHPLHGGTMDNKVAHTLARAFLGLGYVTLRFNFRGVGSSEGAFDDGRGEVDDALCAAAWMRSRYPGLPLWLAGFSFGAAMAIRAAAKTEVAGLVSVAPAARRFAGELSVQPRCPWLIVHGDNDELVPVEDTIEWVNSLEPGPALNVFEDTTHFFHGRLAELRSVVAEFVGENNGSGHKGAQ